MEESRLCKVEILAGEGNLSELRKLFQSGHNQLEIDVALEGAIAFSRIDTAEYLLSLGADFSNYNYQGVYYAAHNNELEGLKFAISKGVDIDVNNGMLLNTCIVTSFNSKSTEMLKWLLDNGADIKLLSSKTMAVFSTPEIEKVLDNYRPRWWYRWIPWI